MEHQINSSTMCFDERDENSVGSITDIAQQNERLGAVSHLEASTIRRL